MNRNRCVIQLGVIKPDSFPDLIDTFAYVNQWGSVTSVAVWARVYGSHSEAKKQLPKWLAKWPDAKIVDAGEL